MGRLLVSTAPAFRLLGLCISLSFSLFLSQLQLLTLFKRHVLLKQLFEAVLASLFNFEVLVLIFTPLDVIYSYQAVCASSDACAQRRNRGRQKEADGQQAARVWCKVS